MPSDSARDQVCTFHRCAISCPHDARRAACIHGPVNRDKENGCPDHRKHVFSYRSEGKVYILTSTGIMWSYFTMVSCHNGPVTMVLDTQSVAVSLCTLYPCGWAASQRLSSSVVCLQDLSPYLPTVIPGLKSSLLDPVPEVRSVSARALGAIIKGMGESGFEDLLPWLMQTLTSEVSPVDRSGAAQGNTIQ